jgi:hypothetical protein
MFKAGDPIIAGKSGGVIGAIVPWKKGYAGVCPAHIFHYGGTDTLRVGSQKARVAHFSVDADLALFPIIGTCKPTELAKPRFGDAILENSMRKRNCKIADVSWSIAYVILPPGDLPGPGDSGTPIIQDGKVVGMLLSMNLGTCRGIAMSSELIKREAEWSA